jgi:hypothetical protein
MSVSKQDRDDYEKGVEYSNNPSVFDIAVHNTIGTHPDTPEYWKGVSGEQFDGDKKK